MAQHVQAALQALLGASLDDEMAAYLAALLEEEAGLDGGAADVDALAELLGGALGSCFARLDSEQQTHLALQLVDEVGQSLCALAVARQQLGSERLHVLCVAGAGALRGRPTAAAAAATTAAGRRARQQQRSRRGGSVPASEPAVQTGGGVRRHQQHTSKPCHLRPGRVAAAAAVPCWRVLLVLARQAAGGIRRRPAGARSAGRPAAQQAWQVQPHTAAAAVRGDWR